ncbi:MAG: AraC family transcriptional regulator [Clostridiales bacterium]|jgi:AraC-like DNA-binding protein|nr:AraC family transcriptional regulator [Clostridiales bacterium]
MAHFKSIKGRPLVPLQPSLLMLDSYQEQLALWNPFSKKGNALCYQFRTGNEPFQFRQIPDGCVDFLFRLAPDQSAEFCGIGTSVRLHELKPDSLYFGFKPYSILGLRLRASCCNELSAARSVLLNDLLPSNAILHVLAESETFEKRVEAICSFARTQLADPGHCPGLADLIEMKLCEVKGKISIEDINKDTFYSQRYCREIFRNSLGVSQKTYAGIMRFQNTVRMYLNGQDCLMDITYENGYFDQAHFNHDFRRFCSNSPLNFFSSLQRLRQPSEKA